MIKCTLRKFPLYITFASPHPFLNQLSSICVVYQYTVQENSTGTVVSTTLQKNPTFLPTINNVLLSIMRLSLAPAGVVGFGTRGKSAMLIAQSELVIFTASFTTCTFYV